MMVKLGHESVDVLIGPFVESIGVGELWECGFHGGGLFDGALLDVMAVIRRKAGESLLEGLGVEEGDWKGADTTAGAAESAGHFTQERSGCPLEPVISFSIERRRAGWSWACHCRSLHFDGEIDDQVAFG
jgi:hypothetical protein